MALVLSKIHPCPCLLSERDDLIEESPFKTREDRQTANRGMADRGHETTTLYLLYSPSPKKIFFAMIASYSRRGALYVKCTYGNLVNLF